MLISERLKNLRLSRKMTMEQVADAMSTTKQNIYKYEHGKIENMPLSRIEDYARETLIAIAISTFTPRFVACL